MRFNPVHAAFFLLAGGAVALVAIFGTLSFLYAQAVAGWVT